MFVGADGQHGSGPKGGEVAAVATPAPPLIEVQMTAIGEQTRKRPGQGPGREVDELREKVNANLAAAGEEESSVAKMMMLLAGVVVIGKVLNKPSAY